MCFGNNKTPSNLAGSEEPQLLDEDRWLYEFPKQIPTVQPEDSLISVDPVQNGFLYGDLTQLGIEPTMILPPTTMMLMPMDPSSINTIATPSLQHGSLNDQTSNINNWLSACSASNGGELSGNEDSSASSRNRSMPNNPSTGSTTGNQSKERASHIDEVDVSQMSKDELKRLKNTEAARQSRKRKFEHTKTLEVQVDQLDARNRELEINNAVLISQNNGHLQRIMALEKQISDMHAVLAAFGMKITQQQPSSTVAPRIRPAAVKKEKLNA